MLITGDILHPTQLDSSAALIPFVPPSFLPWPILAPCDALPPSNFASSRPRTSAPLLPHTSNHESNALCRVNAGKHISGRWAGISGISPHCRVLSFISWLPTGSLCTWEVIYYKVAVPFHHSMAAYYYCGYLSPTSLPISGFSFVNTHPKWVNGYNIFIETL